MINCRVVREAERRHVHMGPRHSPSAACGICRFGAASLSLSTLRSQLRKNWPSSAATRLIVFTLRRRPVRKLAATRNVGSIGFSNPAYRITRSDFAVPTPNATAMFASAAGKGRPAWALAYAVYSMHVIHGGCKHEFIEVRTR